MKVELQCGDTIAIPNGCKAVIKDNVVVFEKEKEENKEEFKRGDVIVSKMNEILLVDRHSFDDRFLRSFVNIKEDRSFCKSSYSLWNELHDWRHATDEEKQILFDKMKEKGLRWNAEKKKVENVRWRAEYGDFYYFIDAELDVIETTENYTSVDNLLWNSHNYFQAKEQAKEAAKRVKETLKKYHEEIGE